MAGRQTDPAMPGVLNSTGCDAMTGVRAGLIEHRPERRPSLPFGASLKGRHTAPGQESRNVPETGTTRDCGASQVVFDTTPVSMCSHLVATNDAMHATVLELRRFRYDYRICEHCQPDDRRVQRQPRIAGLATAGLDARSHMRQVGRGIRLKWLRTSRDAKDIVLKSCDQDEATAVGASLQRSIKS